MTVLHTPGLNGRSSKQSSFGYSSTVVEGDKRRSGYVGLSMFTSSTTFLKMYLPSAKKSKLPSHHVFGVFVLEANKILQATPSK